MRCLLLCLALVLPAVSNAADPQWIAVLGRGLDSADTDIVRLAYRHPLPEKNAWWMPTHVQFGGDVWRVPNLGGITRRLDLNVSAIWRNERRWGYWEAGFGGYLLSKTINNSDTRMPSAFEFGSHLGVGLALTKTQSLGIALQHLSNAGIKQPNGGIDLVLVQYTFSTGR